jgi:type I restriction enzyme S subunit
MEDIFEIARGGSPRPIDSFLTDDPDGVNWVMISDATESGKYINSTKKRIREEGVKRSRVVRPGDFLLTNSMSFGRPYIMNTSGCIHDGWLVLSPRHQNVSPDFFYHLLGSDFVYAEFVRRAAGATVKNLNIDLVKRVQVPLPPLGEQRRIADVLDRAESLRAKRRAALSQLDALIQAIFLDLFGDPNFNERDWPLCRIGSVISDLRGGANLAPDDFVESGFPILHKGAIKPNGEVALDVKKKTFATPEYATANRRCQIDRRYLAVTLRDLVPTGPSIGLIANLQDGPFDGYLLAQGAYGFLVDSRKVTPEYLVFLSNMPSFRHVLRKYTVGSTQIHIRTPVYLDIPIPIPPLSIQREFTRRTAAVKRLEVTQRSTLEKLNALFRSLQTLAFIGRL